MCPKSFKISNNYVFINYRSAILKYRSYFKFLFNIPVVHLPIITIIVTIIFLYVSSTDSVDREVTKVSTNSTRLTLQSTVRKLPKYTQGSRDIKWFTSRKRLS